MDILKNLLDYEFCAAIRICGCRRTILPDGNNGRVSVNAGGGAEYYTLHTTVCHDKTKGDGAFNIVFIIAQRLSS
jgi:hypothetical protein